MSYDIVLFPYAWAAASINYASLVLVATEPEPSSKFSTFTMV